MTQFWMIYLLKLIKLFMCVQLPRVFILISLIAISEIFRSQVKPPVKSPDVSSKASPHLHHPELETFGKGRWWGVGLELGSNLGISDKRPSTRQNQQENHRKTIGKWWFNEISWDFMEYTRPGYVKIAIENGDL